MPERVGKVDMRKHDIDVSRARDFRAPNWADSADAADRHSDMNLECSNQQP